MVWIKEVTIMLTAQSGNSRFPLRLWDAARKNAPHVIAVGGGKGGVGKSSIAVMMAIALSLRGHDTIIIDADLTGANLHGYLGLANEERSLHSFLRSKDLRLQDLVQSTSFERLSAIVGSLGVESTATWKYDDSRRLLQQLRRLATDYVIVDLGAECSTLEIDLFLASDLGVVVSTNDAVSMHNLFQFVRTAVMRKMRRCLARHHELQGKLHLFMQKSETAAVSLEGCFREWGYSPDWVREITSGIRPSIIINMSEPGESSQNVQSLRLATSQLLSVHMDFGGVVHSDGQVRQALRERRPALLCQSGNRAFSDISRYLDRYLPARSPQTAEVNQAKSSGITSLKNWLRGTLCSTRCLAWQSCTVKHGGLPCAMQPVELLRREGCYA
jgi:flagellar biosynthesis protein FlhG